MTENELIEREKYIEEYRQYFKNNFSNLSQQIIQDLSNNKKESVILKKYTKQQIIDALQNPQGNEKKIRDMSLFLYANSSHYRRLCNYFSKLGTFNYSLIPYNIDPLKYNTNKFLNTYRKVSQLLDKFNLKFHLPRIINICMQQDSFYGLYYETDESFDIIQINADYCKISSKEDSNLKFSLNFDFFKTRSYLLDSYGDEIKKMYLNYVGYEIQTSNGQKKNVQGDSKLQWQEPPNQMCFKINDDQLYYSLPPFSGIFPEILNLEEYKLLKRTGEILNRYKLLVMTIPLNDNGTFKIDKKIAEDFYHQACKNIDTGVGIILSPLEVDSIDFQKSSTSDSNAVNEAESALFSATGCNGALFGLGDKLSSSSLNISIKNDESIFYTLLRQIEAWINTYIKKLNLSYDFKVVYLNQTIYNNQDVCDQYKNAAAYGVLGAKTLYQASLGITPSDALGLEVLESVLDYENKWNPLKSSNTQSNDDGGRPTNKDKGKQITDSGEQTIEDDENNR